MGLKAKVIEGASWNIVAQVSVQVLAVGVTIVLARLLNPADFGIVAISDVFFGFAYLFADLGMGAALIQRRQIDDEYLSTSFWVTVLAGLGIVLALSAAAPLIAAFYGEEILKYILILSSTGFLLGSLTSVHTAILTKQLAFNKIALISVASKVLSGTASISMALLGFGVWSLVLGNITAQVLSIPLVWYIVSWRPRFIFRRRCFKEMFGYSSNILAFNVVNYFARNFDNLLIGKVLGAQVLGYYSLAYTVMLKPLSYISWSVGRVLFPALSSIQDDKERVRLAYIRVVRSISLITFPMMVGLIVVAKEFVLGFYGPKWEPVILPLQLLCIVGAMQSIGATVGTVLTSQGRSDLQLKWGLFASSMYVIAFLIGIRWGLIGLIIMYIAVGIPLWPLSHYVANRLIGLEMKSVFKALVPATTASLVMAAALLLMRYVQLRTLDLNIYLLLIVSVIFGAMVYVAVLQIAFKIPEVEELKTLLRRKFVGYSSPDFGRI